MKSSKNLLPLSDHIGKFTFEGYPITNEDTTKSGLRLNRDHLKRYLSTSQLRLPSSLTKKTFELTENNLIIPTSPRILQKIVSQAEIKPSTKEKHLDKMIALKMANKNVLKALSSLSIRKEDAKKAAELIKIPEELKIFENEIVSERSEASKLLGWFEKSVKEKLGGLASSEKLNTQEKEDLIKEAENLLPLALNRLVDQVMTHCNEKAVLVSKFFQVYQRYWETMSGLSTEKLEKQLKFMSKQFDEQKNELISLNKSAKNKVQTLKKQIEKYEFDAKIKDFEIERLNRNIKALKNERAGKLKKELETYEKMVQKIRRKVSIIFIEKSSKPHPASLKDMLMAELHLAIEFKDKHLNDAKIEEMDPEDPIDEVSTSSSKQISVSTETESIKTQEKESYIGFVHFNEETQTDYFELQNIENGSFIEIEPEIKKFKSQGLIPVGADVESWSAGYFSGLERGKTLTSNEIVEVEEKIAETNGIVDEDSLEEEGYEEEKSDKSEDIRDEKTGDVEKKDEKKRKHQTRIKEFHFQKREKVAVQKMMKSKRIREIFTKKSSENIAKRSKMGKKLIMRTINGIYAGLINKYKSEENLEDLLEFVYLDYELKNSMKKVVDRKVMDFLCSLINFKDQLKVKNFLKFLDFAEKINQKPFSYKKDSLLVYISGLDTILKSKLGILQDFDEVSDSYIIPVIRATEFFKEKLADFFPPSRLSKCLEYVEKHSFFDKKRLNKSGLIELELVLDLALTSYEEHLNLVRKNGEFIIKAITCDNSPQFVKKNDLVYLATIFKSIRFLKDAEFPSGEFIKIEEIWMSNVREIFPEEFLWFTEVGTLESEYKKTLVMLKSSKISEKRKYLELFEENGKNLDIEVFPYIRRILEIQPRTYIQ